MSRLLTGAGVSLRTGTGTALEASGSLVDTFDRPYDVGVLDRGWRQFADDFPGAFDIVGVVPGGVGTIALTRVNQGGGLWVPNPANTHGADLYRSYPRFIIPGVGGAYQDAGTDSCRIDVTYGGFYDEGHHTELSAVLHITPSSPLYGIGCWFFMFGGFGIAMVAGIGNPPETVTAIDNALATVVDGTNPVFSYVTDGDVLKVYLDGVQLNFETSGLAGVPIPAELQGSTKHGFAIDQHAVDYVGGQPSLTNMIAAPAMTRFQLVNA